MTKRMASSSIIGSLPGGNEDPAVCNVKAVGVLVGAPGNASGAKPDVHETPQCDAGTNWQANTKFCVNLSDLNTLYTDILVKLMGQTSDLGSLVLLMHCTLTYRYSKRCHLSNLRHSV